MFCLFEIFFFFFSTGRRFVFLKCVEKSRGGGGDKKTDVTSERCSPSGATGPGLLACCCMLMSRADVLLANGWFRVMAPLPWSFIWFIRFSNGSPVERREGG